MTVDRSPSMKVDPDGAGFDGPRLERLTEHFTDRYVNPGKIAGCQIAVTRGGRLAYWRSIGTMDRERAKAVEDDTIWRIYSMTKPITSVALMQLYERGLFQLNDPVHRYIPEWGGMKVGELQPDDSIRLVRPASSGVDPRRPHPHDRTTREHRPRTSDRRTVPGGTPRRPARYDVGEALHAAHRFSRSSSIRAPTGTTGCPPTSAPGWLRSFRA